MSASDTILLSMYDNYVCGIAYELPSKPKHYTVQSLITNKSSVRLSRLLQLQHHHIHI